MTQWKNLDLQILTQKDIIMDIRANIGNIPNYNDSNTLTVKNPDEIKKIRDLQRKYLKANKIKQYGLNMDKTKYKLVKGKVL